MERDGEVSRLRTLIALCLRPSRGLVAAVGALWALSSMLVPAGAATTPPLVAAPCGTAASPPAVYDHVVWIWLENRSFRTVRSYPKAPYLNDDLIPGCGLAGNYHNLTHPSLGNYVGAVSGLPVPRLRRFNTDCDPTGGCITKVASLFGQTGDWKAYEESMRTNCQRHDAGRYAVRHNPPPYLVHLSGCGTNDVAFGALGADLGGGTLPAFSFVTPNLCNDLHDCAIERADDWLARVIPMIVASATYQAGRTAIFLTFDEGEGGTSDHCATNVHDRGCHVLTVAIAPSVRPGTRSGTLFNHYSLLRTTEEMLGLTTYLGRARHAASMRGAFNL